MKKSICIVFCFLMTMLSIISFSANAAIAIPSNEPIKWICDDGVWKAYDYNGNGCYATWISSNGNWYYINYKGAMMHDSWYKIQNSWYYFYSDGRMAHDCYVGGYHLNASGEWDY